MSEITEIAVINKDILEIDNAINTEIVDQVSFAKATDALKMIKLKIKQADDARKVLVKPINDHVKMINAQFAPVLQKLEDLKTNLDKKMCEYLAIERKRQLAIEQERARQEAEELRKKAEDEKLFASWSSDSTEKEEHEVNALIAKSQASQLERKEVVVDDKKICVSGNFATSSVRKSWVYEIVDENLIPRNFLAPDDAAIKQAIKNGSRTIDGLRIFEKETIISR